MKSLTGAVIVLALVVSVASGCRRGPDAVSDEAYREAVVAFHTGIAAMQTSQEVLAREQLERVTTLAPEEPAAWANLGLLLLRQQEDDEAAERLARAEALAPDDAGVRRLLALAAGRRGDLPAAAGHWTRALELEPDDPKAAYALALDLERAGGDDNEARAQETLGALATRTGNLAAQVEFARLAAKRGDAAALDRALDALAREGAAWPDDVRERLGAVRDAATNNPRAAGQPIAFLKNVLLRLPDYRQAVARVSTPREEVGEPIVHFLVLANPASRAAPADESLTFTLEGIADVPGRALWVGTIALADSESMHVTAFDGQALHVPSLGGGGVPISLAPVGGMPATASSHRVLGADLDYDFRMDLVVTGPGGIRILRQTDSRQFEDVTASTGLPRDSTQAPVAGVWAADVDLDGDLDVVVGLVDGPATVLRNNGDGTFSESAPFDGVARVRDFVWADLDGDGVPDAVLLQDDGALQVMFNLRGGAFESATLPTDLPPVVALAAVEASGDAVIDLVALGADGRITRLTYQPAARSWAHQIVAQTTPSTPLVAGHATLVLGDLDNNGAVDLMASAPGWTRILLGAGDGTWRALDAPVALHTHAVADLSGNGRLDLVGVDADGAPAVASSAGSTAYHWQQIRPRAAEAFGDQRINSFGIGGEVEVRTGLHLQKQIISSPFVHVGLGDATTAEIVRITWPNGTLQSEFNVGADTTVSATQRLKGSCPWLFAWDGSAMTFVTDVLWRSPLGLRINAQDTADVLMTEDRVKVRGDQLRARDGTYDLRITAELWETHFFDHVSLLVVDHPADTEIWLDERFAVPAPPLDIVVTGPLQSLDAARDDEGRDVLATLADRDDRHLDVAGPGRYQGITRDHYVELDLPATTPRGVPIWLVAQGWIQPTDSSINVAISQGRHAAPRGLSLHVADEAGTFHMAEPDLGFPAGKAKTVLVDLTPHLPASGPIRLRLATNLEIYWDRVAWATGRPDVEVQPVRLLPETAELRYRGYSAVSPRDASTPERPRYTLEGTMPRWLDLEGYHTRFGDVRPLLLDVDDRYVIMNAGDELQVRFAEAAPPVAGAVRSFVFVSDGWEKDGDFNTTFSRTVLPLPTHDTPRYDTPPRRLEDDPVYQKHPQDFAEYHTRYVTPDRVRHALRPPVRRSQP